MHALSGFIIIVPLLIAAIVFIVIVATRSARHKYRGGNDARNFDDGTTFYPGDAVVNPTSTPPPREHSTGAQVLPHTPTAGAGDRGEPTSAGPAANSDAGQIVSDGLMPKTEQVGIKSGANDPDSSGDPDSVVSEARGAARREETAGGGPEGGGGDGATSGSR